MTTDTTMIRVMLVDDHPIVRESVRQLLHRSGWIEVVAQASAPSQAAELAEIHRPDIIVMDLSMPEGGGLAAMTAIRKQWPDAVFLVLSMYADPDAVNTAMQHGARGFVAKSDDPEDLLRAIDLCIRGSVYLSPDASRQSNARHDGSQPPKAELTERENQILLLVGRGQSLKESAATAGLAYKTAHQHLKSAMRKLGLHSIQEVVHEVVRRERFGATPDELRTSAGNIPHSISPDHPQRSDAVL